MQAIGKLQLQQWVAQKQDMLLIDVLPKADFQNQHVPGAINIPFKDNPDFVDAVRKHVASKDQDIVVYCRNSQCLLSKEAAQDLESAGFTRIRAFEEGVEGWFGKSTDQAAA